MLNDVGNIHKLLVGHLLMLYKPCLLCCVKWFRKYLGNIQEILLTSFMVVSGVAGLLVEMCEVI